MTLSPASPPVRARNIRGWVAAGIALVAMLAVVVTLVTVMNGDRKPRQVIERLAASSELAWPEALVPRPAHSTRHADFLGLVVVSTGWDLDESQGSCLYVSRDGSQSLESFDQSCGSGSLRPTVQVVVSAHSPEELRGRFDEGTTLRFVLDDGEVRVITATDES